MQIEDDQVSQVPIQGSDNKSYDQADGPLEQPVISPVQEITDKSDRISLNFGDAFSDMLANGARLSRESWGNSSKFIYLDNEVTPKGIFLNEGEVCHEWVARHVDLLAKDWFVVK